MGSAPRGTRLQAVVDGSLEGTLGAVRWVGGRKDEAEASRFGGKGEFQLLRGRRENKEKVRNENKMGIFKLLQFLWVRLCPL